MGLRAARAPELSRSSAPRGFSAPITSFSRRSAVGQTQATSPGFDPQPAVFPCSQKRSLLSQEGLAALLQTSKVPWKPQTQPAGQPQPSHAGTEPQQLPHVLSASPRPRSHEHHGSVTGPPRASSPRPSPTPTCGQPASHPTPPPAGEGDWKTLGASPGPLSTDPSERRRVAARSRAARSSSFCSGRAQMMQNSSFFFRSRGAPKAD